MIDVGPGMEIDTYQVYMVPSAHSRLPCAGPRIIAFQVQVYDDGASKLPPSLWEALAGLDLLPPPPPTSGDWETDDFSVTQHKKVS